MPPRRSISTPDVSAAIHSIDAVDTNSRSVPYQRSFAEHLSDAFNEHQDDGRTVVVTTFEEDPGIIRHRPGFLLRASTSFAARQRTLELSDSGQQSIGMFQGSFTASSSGVAGDLNEPLVEAGWTEDGDIDLVEDLVDEHGHPISAEGRNGLPATILAFFKAFLGTSILFIPHGFKDAGMIPGAVTTLISGSLTCYCILLLLETKAVLTRRVGRPVVGYADIATLAAGPVGKWMVDAATIMSQMAFATVYVAFVGKNMGSVISFGLDVRKASLLWMVVAATCWVPLCWIRRLQYFTTTNAMAMFIIMSSMVVLACCFTYQVVDAGPGPSITWSVGQGFVGYFGTAVYAFEGICVIPFIEQEMKDKHLFKTVVLYCMATIVFMVVSMGVMGYLAFGGDTQSIILQNLEGMSELGWWKTAVKAFLVTYCFACLCSFPLTMTPPIRITTRMIFKDQENSGYKWTKNLWRACLIGMCLGVAIGTSGTEDGLSHFVSLSGALNCVPLALTFPAYFHLKAVSEHGGTGKKRDYAIIVFGSLGSVVAITSSVMSWAGHPIKLY